MFAPSTRGHMKRRDFIAAFGGAVAWPRPAHAQQAPVPVIGFLNLSPADTSAERLRAFRQGLRETGHVEGENVTIEYRWAENHSDRLPLMAADLIRRQVSVVVAAGGSAPALAAKAATTTIPIVFAVPEDPVRLGLVASLARPQGNATGINFFSNEVLAKRLEILRELVPRAARIAMLVSPAQAIDADATVYRDVQEIGRAMGLQLQVVNANTAQEIDAAFAMLASDRPDALLVAGGPLHVSRRVQFALLAARHAIPTSYGSREYAEVGGLMSYGTSLTDAYRRLGDYTSRILKGTHPADLPVLQASKFELVINHQAARVLGLTIPPALLARADEVIE
jgi:putative ABC transport system substrate-binding protein